MSINKEKAISPHLVDTAPLPEANESSKNIHSIRDLINYVSGRDISTSNPQEDAGLAEQLPYPFLGIVGQVDMKLSLALALINPNISGVLLIGPRGTGKTTAVRSLLDILPDVERSNCFYGCLPEDIFTGGIDAVCPECAKKNAEGIAISRMDKVRLYEIPLNSRLEDVIGGIDERSSSREHVRIKKGLLSLANLNILFVDEVNLLSNEIVDAVLDAASQGTYHVHRGPVSAIYKSRFTFIGSMNPEEGAIRPQIMDRFGLRVVAEGLTMPEERLEAYRRVIAFKQNPREFIASYSQEMRQVRDEILSGRQNLHKVLIPDFIAKKGIQLIDKMKIDSLRAEITLFEGARALAAAEGRDEVIIQDLVTIAPMALRMRSSKFMADFLKDTELEGQELAESIKLVLTNL
jgi:magnesium chelatase subunit I